MKLLVGLLIAALVACAMLAANQRKPFEMKIDAQSPGAWPKYAAANEVEMIDQYACMRLLVPYEVTTDPRKGVVHT